MYSFLSFEIIYINQVLTLKSNGIIKTLDFGLIKTEVTGVFESGKI